MSVLDISVTLCMFNTCENLPTTQIRSHLPMAPDQSLHHDLYRLTRLFIIPIRRACYCELINPFRSFLCESDFVIFDLHKLLILCYSVLRLHRQLRTTI